MSEVQYLVQNRCGWCRSRFTNRTSRKRSRLGSRTGERLLRKNITVRVVAWPSCSPCGHSRTDVEPATIGAYFRGVSRTPPAWLSSCAGSVTDPKRGIGQQGLRPSKMGGRQRFKTAAAHNMLHGAPLAPLRLSRSAHKARGARPQACRSSDGVATTKNHRRTLLPRSAKDGDRALGGTSRRKISWATDATGVFHQPDRRRPAAT